MMSTMIFVSVLAALVQSSLAVMGWQPAHDVVKNVSAAAVTKRVDVGIDEESINTYVSVGEDFYGYANGKYFLWAQLPENQSRLTQRDELASATLFNIRTILEEDTGKIGTFYKSFINEETLSAKGLEPLRGLLSDVTQLHDAAGIGPLAAKGSRSSLASPFGLSVDLDPRDPSTYVVSLSGGGLGLPNREYYISSSKDVVKTAYKAYVASVLDLLDIPDSQQASADLLALEEGFARAHLPPQDLSNSSKTYNVRTPKLLANQAPGFDWNAYLLEAGLTNSDTRMIVPAPSTVIAMAKLIGGANLSVIKAWFALHTYNSVAHLLPKPYSGLYFNFYGKLLAGRPLPTARWIRGVNLLNRYMGDSVGQAFVSKYFSREAKDKAEVLVSQLKTTFESRLKNIDWMTNSTKKKAQAKLQQLDIQVGYPKTFKNDQAVVINEDDLVGNVNRLIARAWKADLARLGQPVDRTEWFVTPQEVNAYSNPQLNQIVFPAALLQPPFFHSDFDMAVNLGAIGTLIGREIVHSFDRIGRYYNGEGKLSDWWTPDDEAAYKQRTDLYARQFKSVDLGPNASGMQVNLGLTLDEDVADLGGLSLASQTYHTFRNLTALTSVYMQQEGDRRVFLAWGQTLRTLVRPEAFPTFLASDKYSPAQARANGPVKHIDGWYKAFQVSEISPGYVKPESRVSIW